MKAVIVYDSVYGNTQKVAEAIGAAIAGEVKVAKVGQVDPADLGPVDLLVVGSPTLGGRASQPMQEFLAKIPDSSVNGVKIAAFDTRYAGRFVKMFGYAAERMAEALTGRGGRMVAPPQAFIVMGKKGPLKDGELEHAAAWAKEIAK